MSSYVLLPLQCRLYFWLATTLWFLADLHIFEFQWNLDQFTINCQCNHMIAQVVFKVPGAATGTIVQLLVFKMKQANMLTFCKEFVDRAIY